MFRAFSHLSCSPSVALLFFRYYVEFLASGTGGVIYTGSYLYHRHDSPFIVRYDLEDESQVEQKIEGMAHKDCPKSDKDFTDCNVTERDQYLYGLAHNYVDFAVDENGLWVIYQYQDVPWLGVAKLDFANLTIVATWNITVANVTKVANTFIMCGVLYGLGNGSARDSFISFGYDLYDDRQILVNVTWFNPYHGNTMLDYNPIDRRIYFYDSGSLLSVNVRVNQNATSLPDPDFDT